MIRKVFRWMRTHRWQAALVVVAAGVIALNVVAFNQAWSMTHFREGGTKTAESGIVVAAAKGAGFTSGR